jgi:hypothetical protein
MIDDRCDYCFREFGWEPGAPAICMNCGLENVRLQAVVQTAIAEPKVETATIQPGETAMLPGVETAVKPAPRRRRTRRK